MDSCSFGPAGCLCVVALEFVISYVCKFKMMTQFHANIHLYHKLSKES